MRVGTPALDSRAAALNPRVARFTTQGSDVVKAIEALGSGSGKPSATVTIADSGELPAEADEAGDA